MRLINTTTGRFQEYFDTQRPVYAILSHKWGDDEISYLDFLCLTRDLPASALGIVSALLRNPNKESEGYRKVEACCKLARSRGFEWVWIDSCCIDKSSSAELSEAINSMWSWYRDAAECYVYLFDVVTTDKSMRNRRSAVNELSPSKWFTRGWTLQELLAPKDVLFCNSRWEILATKAEIGTELSSITKIPLVFLDGSYDPGDLKMCSVAMKMSWLSRRETSRVEDMAYCMLGLFDVHMPLIYGEGRKAFMRLQLEIIKKTDDDSIYAWTGADTQSGLLATWPTAFVNSGNIVQIAFPEDRTLWIPPIMTSIGMDFKARYQRHDPHREAVDARYGVHSISIALPPDDEMDMIMHCGPCGSHEVPITKQFGPRRSAMALRIYMKRFTATWQRVGCEKFDFVNYATDNSTQSDAFMVYYIEQQGL